MASTAHSSPEILFEQRGPLGLITLNRPDQLNALTHDMVKRMDAQLSDWAAEAGIVLVAITGAGDRAFCAGGDIRAIYEASRTDPAANAAFYRDEYRLNRRIKRYAKPYIAFIDGVVMGGGVGVSIHGRYRVGGEKILFAMPETGIGLFPDVGGSFFLPRLPNHVGMHLGLTGARLDAAGCINAHLLDYVAPSGRIPTMIDQLAAAEYDDAPDEIICEILALNSLATKGAALKEHAETIAACYGGDSDPEPGSGTPPLASSVEEILTRLDAAGPWAEQQAAIIRQKSPTSLKMTFRQLRAGAGLDFEDCLRLEYRLARACLAGSDFFEGVRAVVIDKDNAPKWAPASLAEVSEASLDAAFAPLGADELSFED